MIAIQPFDDADMPLVFQWCQAFWNSVADDDVPRDQAAFVNFKLLQNSLNLAVYNDGQLAGMLSCDPVNTKVCQAHVIFRKEFWGRETTEPGLRLGIEFAFKLGYTKIACIVFEHNTRMRALIEKIGGEQEGYHRAQTRQNGKPINMVSYGIFKEGSDE